MASLNSDQTSAAVSSTNPTVSASTRQSTNNLVEQIRLLEAEGNVLRSSPTSNVIQLIGAGTDSCDPNGSPDMKNGMRRAFTPMSPGTLSALVDISAEQKTISELRSHLDAQRRETERLHQHLQGDYSTGMPTIASRYPTNPHRTGFSTVPTSDLFSAHRLPSDYIPPSHLEKALKDSQEQVSELRKRLMEANEHCEHQNGQFRTNIEDLKSNLHDTMVVRNSVLDLRQKEVNNQDSMIARLQSSIQQFQEKCQAQEEALLHANKKVESYRHDNYITETAMNQIRLVLSEMEKKRGHPYFDSDSVGKQGPAMLVHTFERSLQETNKHLEEKSERIQKLESELEEMKKNTNQNKEDLINDQQQRITLMTNEHEKQLNTAVERDSNSKKQAANLQSQLQLLEGQHEQQLKLKDEMVVDTENKIRHLKEEFGQDRLKWQEKRDAIEGTLDDLQKELSQVRTERDEALRNQSALEARLEDFQTTIGRLDADLATEKDKNGELWERESALKNQRTELENKLDNKKRDIDRLESMLELVKQECNAKMNDRISFAEKQERDQHMDQVSTLTAQLNTITETNSKVTLNMELSRIENNNLKQEVLEVTEKFNTNKIRLEASEAEKKHLANLLSDKTSDMDRLSKERDYYFNFVEKRNEEVTDLRSQKEKLSIQSEENERNMIMLQQQSSNVSHLLEANSRNSDSLREEKEQLLKLLNDKTIALEELKSFRENTAKKIKSREKRITKLEEEKQKHVEAMQIHHQEMSVLQEEKDNLYKELKESRYEVATITEERDALKHGVTRQRAAYRRELIRLHGKLKGTEHDLKLSQKTLKIRESVDNQAVKVADKVQKQMTAKRSEVDTLKSKVHWIQDKLESEAKERNVLEGDKDKLKSSLNKALLQNQQLSSDLENARDKNLDQRNGMSRLEASLEKATVKNSSLQAQLERFEQELTRLKLMHQLDIKEAVQRQSTNQPHQGQHVLYDTQPITCHEDHKSTSGRSTPVKKECQSSSGRSTPVSKDMLPNNMQQTTTENYRDVGEDLKALLQEMRSLISEKKDSSKVRGHTRRMSDHVILKSQLPVQSNLKSTNVDSLLADLDYHSDTELDLSNSQSDIQEWSGFSSLRGDRSRNNNVPQSRHRSHSVDMSFGRGEKSNISHGDSVSNDFSQQSTISDSTETAANSMTIRLVPDTKELCKRLEEKIESLSKMGGHLQKENQEMSQLIKEQGKKLKKVRDSEKHTRRPTR